MIDAILLLIVAALIFIGSIAGLALMPVAFIIGVIEKLFKNDDAATSPLG